MRMARPAGHLGDAARDAVYLARKRVGRSVRSLKDACAAASAVVSSPEAAALVREAARAGQAVTQAAVLSACKAAPACAQLAAQVARQAADALRASASWSRAEGPADVAGRADAGTGGRMWEPADGCAALADAACAQAGEPGSRAWCRAVAGLEVWTTQVEPEDGDVTDVPVVFAAVVRTPAP